MRSNEIAVRFLEAFAKDEAFPGGLSFRTALKQSGLDLSTDSLGRIDTLLDEVKRRYQLSPEAFYQRKANQNFLLFLAFYFGMVVAEQIQAQIEWLTYEEMIARIPDNGPLYPHCFGTSFTCILHRPQSSTFFVPLHSIENRLFEDEARKSVKLTGEKIIQNANAANF